jgi:hypothetical protein
VTDFLYGFSIGLGFSKAVIDPINENLFELKVGSEDLGTFTNNHEALEVLEKYLSERGGVDQAIIARAKDIRFWDRYFVDTFNVENE